MSKSTNPSVEACNRSPVVMSRRSIRSRPARLTDQVERVRSHVVPADLELPVSVDRWCHELAGLEVHSLQASIAVPSCTTATTWPSRTQTLSVSNPKSTRGPTSSVPGHIELDDRAVGEDGDRHVRVVGLEQPVLVGEPVDHPTARRIEDDRLVVVGSDPHDERRRVTAEPVLLDVVR